MIEAVNMTSEPVTITNTKGKSAVLVSEDDWKAIQETLYLHAIPGMAESILSAAKEPLEDGIEYKEDEEW